MLKAFYVYMLTLLVFFAIDIVWIGVVAKDFYQQKLAHIFAPDINWTAAVLFYLLYIAGILVFATAPALREGSRGQAALLGAFLGLIAYATYDLTNLATVRDWPLMVTVVDMIWGTALTSTLAVASFQIARWIGWQPS